MIYGMFFFEASDNTTYSLSASFSAHTQQATHTKSHIGTVACLVCRRHAEPAAHQTAHTPTTHPT